MRTVLLAHHELQRVIEIRDRLGRSRHDEMRTDEALGRIVMVRTRVRAALKRRQGVQACQLLPRALVPIILEGILETVERPMAITRSTWNMDASNKILPTGHQLAQIVQIVTQSQTYLPGLVVEVRCPRLEAEEGLLSTSKQLNLTELPLPRGHRIDIREYRQIPTTRLHQLLQTLVVCIPLVSNRLHPQLSLRALLDSLLADPRQEHAAALQLMRHPAPPLRAEALHRPALQPEVMVPAVDLARLGTK